MTFKISLDRNLPPGITDLILAQVMPKKDRGEFPASIWVEVDYNPGHDRATLFYRAEARYDSGLESAWGQGYLTVPEHMWPTR